MDFDINEIYTSIASYKGLPFPKGLLKLPGYKINQFKDRLDYISGKKRVKDMYGHNLIVPVIINGIEMGSQKDGHILLQPMVSFEGNKKIVKNYPVGGNKQGSYKQFINIDDYKIEMYGALINTNQKAYPTEQLEVMLEKLWKVNEAVTFECEITDGLFSHIVIEKIKLLELKNAPGWQMYEIKAISDAIHEAEILEAK